MRNALLLSVLLHVLGMTACVPKPPPPAPTPHLMDMAHVLPILPTCPAKVLAVITDECDGFFTQAGMACASCPGGGACFDAVDDVYCAVGGSCLGDATCYHRQDNRRSMKKDMGK